MPSRAPPVDGGSIVTPARTALTGATYHLPDGRGGTSGSGVTWAEVERMAIEFTKENAHG